MASGCLETASILLFKSVFTLTLNPNPNPNPSRRFQWKDLRLFHVLRCFYFLHTTDKLNRISQLLDDYKSFYQCGSNSPQNYGNYKNIAYGWLKGLTKE